MPVVMPEIKLAGISPEISLVVAALVLLIAHVSFREKMPSWYLPWMATVGLGVAMIFAVVAWGITELHMAGAIVLDGFATFVKVTLAVFGLLTVWLGREYVVRHGRNEAEFYALILFAVAGMMLLAAAGDLIVMFLALETFSLALYVMVGLRERSAAGQEAALKYFLVGSFSSAFFLLGIALAYGAAGSTNLYGEAPGDASITGFLGGTPVEGYGLLLLATGLLIVGLGFKVAAVPFHMWTPDAYQGAPSPVTGFMAAGSKIAGFAALIRLLDTTLFGIRWDWQPLVVGIAILTMAVGALFAVVQEDVKRLLAYSSIAHAGFVLTAVVAANDRGIAGSLFYLATYGLIVLGAFAVVSVLEGHDEGGNLRLVDYKGLFYERPLLAGTLTLFLLALAGVPTTSGFVAKLVVFGAAVEAGYWWLAAIGAVASAVAAFFYLRVLVVMYMQEAEERREVSYGPLAGGVIGITAAATVFLGLYWQPLIDAASRATVFFSAP